ncbi:hypothetical protein BU16DRAFT_568212 [Lophium mytilinum]|uniref:Uncharacterized protein n=1 Tax=Lophium mytilinum TaxID=390894 RepID=A0A6A6QAP5_9PEZI|nr:hypothetical protein BU16DRAFT_568212 [Lophium mytilinum]
MPIKFSPAAIARMGLFNINHGVSEELDSTKYFDNLQFPGATFATGSSAYNVWWKAAKDEDHCRIALMTDYSQWHYNQLGGPIQPYGNVIINAGRDGGCYFSAIPEGSNLSGTFCCGVGDCALISAGNDALTLRKGAAEAASKKEEAQTLSKKHEERSPELESETSHSFSPAARARARALVAREDCVATPQGDAFPAAGYQTLVANTQTCTTGSCSFLINKGISLSTTMTSTSDQTITNTVGASVTTTAGSDLLGFQVAVGVSYDFAIAIGKSMSEAVQNGTTVTVTNNLGQALGTTAFATFTPTYNCYMATVDCGHGVSDPLEFCNPALSEDGTTLLGDYNVVYI